MFRVYFSHSQKFFMYIITPRNLFSTTMSLPYLITQFS